MDEVAGGKGLDGVIAAARKQAPGRGLPPVHLWNPAHCGDLPGGVDLMVFDAAVNSGVGRAIRLLQRAVGVDDDGAFGPATKAAVAARTPKAVIDAYHDAHAAFYEGLPTFWKYGKGWLARNDRTRSIAQGMT